MKLVWKKNGKILKPKKIDNPYKSSKVMDTKDSVATEDGEIVQTEAP